MIATAKIISTSTLAEEVGFGFSEPILHSPFPKFREGGYGAYGLVEG
jgi:hypothetical protein